MRVVFIQIIKQVKTDVTFIVSILTKVIKKYWYLISLYFIFLFDTWFYLTVIFVGALFQKIKKNGRNPKCDGYWIKLQRKQRNKSPKWNKREIKVQKEYGKSRCDLKKKQFLRPRCKIAVKNASARDPEKDFSLYFIKNCDILKSKDCVNFQHVHLVPT